MSRRMESNEPSSSDRIKQSEEICLPGICRDNLETIYCKLEELEKQIPPAWTFRAFGWTFAIVIGAFISLQTWLVGKIYEMDAEQHHQSSQLQDHENYRSELRTLNTQFSDLNAQVRVLADRVERYCIRQGTPKTE